MIWATVSFRSCFCWLYRASPSLAAKNIISLISVLTIWWCPCVEYFLCCWKRVFAMTSVFSVSLCPASFCTPRPNLPVTPGSSWLPTFEFQSPMMKEKERKKVKSLSHVQPSATLWTVVYQAPPSMRLSRQEYWSGLSFPMMKRTSFIWVISSKRSCRSSQKCLTSASSALEVGA